MRPTLAELPPPPAGRRGWPWTEESVRADDEVPGRPWPRITVVTPSFNQGRYIEETIRSVLLQGYPNLEYFVLDGGSTDETVDVIRRYSPWIDFWVSERDKGQSSAINRGLRMATGSHATWINSDDMLCRNALLTHVGRHELEEDLIHIGDCLVIDSDSRVMYTHRARVHSLEDLLRIPTVWKAGGFICQQEVLFPRLLALSIGGVNENDHYSMDYELWGKFFLAGARVQYTGIPFGMFRVHEAQKTQHSHKQTESTLDAAEMLLASTEALSATDKHDILGDLQAYRKQYPDIAWRHTGRLARLGLPSWLVSPIRHLKTSVQTTVDGLMRSGR